MSELKPCPFCGRSMGAGDYAVGAMGVCLVCANCGASSEWLDTRDEVIAAWNRRTPQPVTPAGVLLHDIPGDGGTMHYQVTPAGGEVGRCCYGGYRPKSACASCAAWTPTNPPVADAALARDAERYRFLRNDALYYAYASSGLRPMPWCAIGMDKRNFRLAEKEDLDAAIDAALNQRGGGAP